MEILEMNSNDIHTFFDAKRKELDARYADERWGWTPCPHYNNAIGWCPVCVGEKERWQLLSDQMNEIFPLDRRIKDDPSSDSH